MTRVAFFADILSEDFDGASRTMYQIISRIDNSEFTYKFYTGHNALKETNKSLYDIEKTVSLSVPFQKRYKMSLPYFNLPSLLDRLDQFSPEVIHIATPSLLGNYALKYANKRNIPVITIFHTYFSSYIKYYFRLVPPLATALRKLSDYLQKRFYNRCDKVYVPAQVMLRELVSIGVDESKIEVWARGIDKSFFNPKHRDIDYIQNITGNTKKNILFVSRLVWEKNLADLIDIYVRIQDLDLPYNFIVAGSGHAENVVRRKMPNAYFTGNMNHKELSKLYASSDLLIFPSISETFGNVVLESLASGIPAVVASRGGTRDMIKPGYNGQICDEKDIESFVNAISSILEHDDVHSTYMNNARDSAMSYNWEELTNRYFSEVKNLAEGKPHS